MVCMLSTQCLLRRSVVIIVLGIPSLVLLGILGVWEMNQQHGYVIPQKSIFRPVRPERYRDKPRDNSAISVFHKQHVLNNDKKLVNSALAMMLNGGPYDYDEDTSTSIDLTSHELATRPVTNRPLCEINRVRTKEFNLSLVQDMECVHMKVAPSTPVCLFPDERDVYVSASIHKIGIWESHIVKKYQQILWKYSEIKVLDIGAHIGMYSLIAAQMGHDVVAVEPNIESVERLKRAAPIGNASGNVTIIQNAVTDTCGPVHILLNEKNQGDTRVVPDRGLKNVSHMLSTEGVNFTIGAVTESITIDDLTVLYNPGDVIAMKIDVQGYENKVLQHATELFRKTTVAFIFMEWVLMRDLYVTDVHESEEKTFLEETLSILEEDYVPFSLGSGAELNVEGWFGWPEDILWVYVTYLEY